MKNQVLSIEQCKKLLALGVDMSNASCMWTHIKAKQYLLWRENDEDVPMDEKEYLTFTIQDMLEILFSVTHKLDDAQYFIASHSGITIERDAFEGSYTTMSFDGDLLESAFSAIIWCKENNYI